MKYKPLQLSELILHDNRLWGWATGSLAPSSMVHLYLDGRSIASEYFGQPLPSALKKKITPPSAAQTFCFALPAQLDDGLEHSLQASTGAEEHSLFSATLLWPARATHGEVMQQGSQLVGTVWFTRKPAKKPALHITSDIGKQLYALALNISRQEEAKGYPAHFSLPLAPLGQQYLHVKCGDHCLRGSPLFPIANVRGELEIVEQHVIQGWAINMIDLRQSVELALRIDGKVHSTFYPNQLRDDIGALLSLPKSSNNLFGFVLSAPAIVCDGKPHLIEVIVAGNGLLLNKGHRNITWQKAGVRYQPEKFRAKSKPLKVATPAVSVIILNRNGAALMEKLLSSWVTHNRTLPVELIVIDHASTDDSLDVLKRWQPLVDLTIVPLPRNDSFSASCNHGAKLARSPLLLFLNNDILWLHDALPVMVDTLNDDAVGIVGMKLLKATPSSYRFQHQSEEVLHLGVRFKLPSTSETRYMPFEVDPHSSSKENEFAAQKVPAVTGAALLCRKSDFENVGGFDTAYFYGFEDVEFCFRLANRLDKQVICRNDCAALHYQGHTRLSGREQSVISRLAANTAILEQHSALWLKQKWWQSLLRGDGFFSGETLTIGLIGAAQSLAPVLSVTQPDAEIFLIQQEAAWKKVRDFHVLLVGDPLYDIRFLQNPRSDLLTIAYVQTMPQQWQNLPWLDQFEAVLAPAAKISEISKSLKRPCQASSKQAPLGQLLNTSRQRIRVNIVVDNTDTQHYAHARKLQIHLRQQDIAAWIIDSPDKNNRMVEFCITLHSSKKMRLHSKVEGGVIHISWPIREAKPSASWLVSELEKHLGSTFFPS